MSNGDTIKTQADLESRVTAKMQVLDQALKLNDLTKRLKKIMDSAPKDADLEAQLRKFKVAGGSGIRNILLAVSNHAANLLKHSNDL